MKHTYSFCTDNRLCVTFWGESIAELTGRSSSVVLGRKYYDFLSRIFVDNKDAISMALKKNKTLTLRGYCFNCLIDQIKADIRIKPIKARTSEVNKVRVYIYNYSPCSLSKQLQNSQRLIDIGRISSTFAHGIRNPLNAIKGAVVYIREKYANEPTLIEFTKIMEDEISRLDNFISRFLSTSITETEFSQTDINSLLRKIEVYTSLQARANNITPIFEYGKIPPVMINSFQFELAILNVINNAIDAMPLGGQLTVKTRSEKNSGINFAVIEIADTGHGMAESKIDDLSMPIKNKGKGFGLFLTREILQYYKGNLEIKSKKGLGTTVNLYLPTYKGVKG